MRVTAVCGQTSRPTLCSHDLVALEDGSFSPKQINAVRETWLWYTYRAEILQRSFQMFELSRKSIVALSYQDDAIKTTEKQNMQVTHL